MSIIVTRSFCACRHLNERSTNCDKNVKQSAVTWQHNNDMHVLLIRIQIQLSRITLNTVYVELGICLKIMKLFCDLWRNIHVSNCKIKNHLYLIMIKLFIYFSDFITYLTIQLCIKFLKIYTHTHVNIKNILQTIKKIIKRCQDKFSIFKNKFASSVAPGQELPTCYATVLVQCQLVVQVCI